MHWLENTICVWGWLTAICTIFMAVFKHKSTDKKWLKVIIKIANCFSVIKYQVKAKGKK